MSRVPSDTLGKSKVKRGSVRRSRCSRKCCGSAAVRNGSASSISKSGSRARSKRQCLRSRFHARPRCHGRQPYATKVGRSLVMVESCQQSDREGISPHWRHANSHGRHTRPVAWLADTGTEGVATEGTTTRAAATTTDQKGRQVASRRWLSVEAVGERQGADDFSKWRYQDTGSQAPQVP